MSKQDKRLGGNEDTFGECVSPIKRTDLTEGTRIHRYLILGLVGKGGMGAVYKAYDPELDRRIAIKILTLSPQQGETASVPQARLMREAQALAKLNHPNVVSVFDVGTYQDGVYIAMEYVDGKTFRDWLKEDNPTLKEKLDVLIAAGQGLEAAHAQGIVHRDFKPENLLVGQAGQVKVLDFGLARGADFGATAGVQNEPLSQIESQSGDNILSQPLTQVGARIGTPVYMAPEHFQQQELDEKTDQFSFSVTCFEAFFGKRPFRAKTLDDLALKVTEGPIRIPDGASVPKWIQEVVFRGLSKSKRDRYASLTILLKDLQFDPEAAKRAAQKKRIVTLLISFLSLLPFGIWFMLTNAGEVCSHPAEKLSLVWSEQHKQKVSKSFASTELTYAVDSFVRVDKLFDGYLAQWATMYTQTCTATKIRGEQPVEIMVLKMGCLDKYLGNVEALSQIFQEADKTVVAKAVQAASSLPGLAACNDIESLQSRIRPAQSESAKTRAEQIREKLTRVGALRRAGKYQEALAVSNKALVEADNLGYLPVQAEALFWQGELQTEVGRYHDAKETLVKAAQLGDKARHEVIRTKALVSLLSVVGHRLSQFEEAMSLNRWVEYAVARFEGKWEIETAWRSNLGHVFWRMGDHRQALDYLMRAMKMSEKELGKDHPTVARRLNGIGLALWEKGEYDNALSYFERSLGILKKTLGPQHPNVTICLNNLGLAYIHRGDFDKALQYLQASLRIKEKTYGPSHPKMATTLENLGHVFFHAKGDYARAQAFYARAHAIWERSHGPEHPNISIAKTGLGWIHLRQGELVKSISFFEQVFSICGKMQCNNDEGEGFSATHLGLGLALWQQGKARHRALKLVKKARELLSRKHSYLAKQMLADCADFLNKHDNPSWLPVSKAHTR